MEKPLGRAPSGEHCFRPENLSLLHAFDTTPEYTFNLQGDGDDDGGYYDDNHDDEDYDDGDDDSNDSFTISSSLPWISAARTLALSVSPSITTLVAAKCCQNEDDVDDDDDDDDCSSDNNNTHIAVLSN